MRLMTRWCRGALPTHMIWKHNILGIVILSQNAFIALHVFSPSTEQVACSGVGALHLLGFPEQMNE